MTSGSERSSDKRLFLEAVRHLSVFSDRCLTSRELAVGRAVGEPPTRIHSYIGFASERSIPNAWSCYLVGCHRKPAPWGHPFSVFLSFCLKSRRRRPLPGGPPWEPAARTPGAARAAPSAASEEWRPLAFSRCWPHFTEEGTEASKHSSTTAEGAKETQSPRGANG